MSGNHGELDPAILGRKIREFKESMPFVPKENSPHEFCVTVDYSKSLEEMINEAQFDYLNSGISGEHFKVKGEGSVNKAIVLFQFTVPKTTEEIVEFIQAQGYEPSGIEDLIALATEYPDEQKTGYPIIELGTIWKRAEKEEVVAVLRGGNNDRNMHLLRTANKWSPSERFAATKTSTRIS